MRRRLLVAGAVAAAPLLVVAACSFPDVTFGPPSGGTSGGGSEGGPVSESGAAEAGANSEPNDFFAGDAQADVITVRSDAQARIDDASVCASRPRCDCDEDGWLAKTGCDAGPNPGKPIGDCDDLDPLRNPDAGYNSTPTADGDWNCDGHVDKGFKVGNWCSGIGIGGCTAGEGYENTDPSCGVAGDLFTCQANSAISPCGLVFANDNKPQACR